MNEHELLPPPVKSSEKQKSSLWRRPWFLFTLIIIVLLGCGYSYLAVVAKSANPLEVAKAAGVISPSVHPLSGPRLELPSCATNLGEGNVGQVLAGTVKARNTGSEPLTFRIDSTCACAHLNPAQGTLEPGGVREISVGVRLRERGTKEHVFLRFHTNEKDAPLKEYLFIALCSAPFAVHPPAIDFGNVLKGTTREALLTVYDPLDKPVPPAPGVRVSCSSPYFAVNHNETAKGRLQFLVALKKNAPRGDVRGTIRLDLMEVKSKVEGDKVFEIPVSAHVQGPVQVAPSILYLRNNPRTQKWEDAYIVVWRIDGIPLGSLAGAAAPKGLIAEDVNDGKMTERRRVRIKAGDDKQLKLPVEVRMKFHGTEEEVVVKVKSLPAPKGPAKPAVSPSGAPQGKEASRESSSKSGAP